MGNNRRHVTQLSRYLPHPLGTAHQYLRNVSLVPSMMRASKTPRPLSDLSVMTAAADLFSNNGSWEVGKSISSSAQI